MDYSGQAPISNPAPCLTVQYIYIFKMSLCWHIILRLIERTVWISKPLFIFHNSYRSRWFFNRGWIRKKLFLWLFFHYSTHMCTHTHTYTHTHTHTYTHLNIFLRTHIYIYIYIYSRVLPICKWCVMPLKFLVILRSPNTDLPKKGILLKCWRTNFPVKNYGIPVKRIFC